MLVYYTKDTTYSVNLDIFVTRKKQYKNQTSSSTDRKLNHKHRQKMC